MPCPMGGKPLLPIGAGIYPAPKWGFFNTPCGRPFQIILMGRGLNPRPSFVVRQLGKLTVLSGSTLLTILRTLKDKVKGQAHHSEFIEGGQGVQPFGISPQGKPLSEREEMMCYTLVGGSLTPDQLKFGWGFILNGFTLKGTPN